VEYDRDTGAVAADCMRGSDLSQTDISTISLVRRALLIDENMFLNRCVGG
jgi:hypothetical protein